MSKAWVSISLGSNIDSERNIRQAVHMLRKNYSELVISPVYQTAAVGFEGDDFLNLAVSFYTDDSVATVVKVLKDIEDSMGRDRSLPKFAARTIDIDLLTYDDLVMDQDGIQIPRDEILKNAFVLKPLSDIHGDLLHPVLKKTYDELWQQMQKTADRIDLFDMDMD